MNELRELFRYVDRYGRPENWPEGEMVMVPIPSRVLRVLRTIMEVGRDAHNTATVLIEEIAELREQRRDAVDALRGLVESIKTEQASGGLENYTEGFVKAYDAATDALMRAKD